MSTVKIVLVGLVLLAGGAVAGWLVGKPAASDTPSVPESRDGTDADAVQGIGYVEPLSEVRSLSFKGGGVIAECPARIGGPARAGEVLMVLDDAEERNALTVADSQVQLAIAERDDLLSGLNPHEIRVAEKSVELARERMTHAEKDFARHRELSKGNSVAKSEQDDVETTFNQAIIELRRAEVQLQYLQNFVTAEKRLVADKQVQLAEARRVLAAQRLADTCLLAPQDGTVLEILRREGEAVSAFFHEPVVLFAETSRLRVRAEIDERYVQALKPGQSVRVFGRTLGGKQYRGRIALIKDIMGNKTVFARSATEKRDLDIVQVLVDMEADFSAPIGLRVDVAVPLDSAGE
jgi:HlyD family secretion protein